METEQNFAIKYDMDIQYGSFPMSQVKSEEKGGCDAMVFASILRGGETPHSGNKSIAITTIDGSKNGEQIPDTELFQVFTHLARYLGSDESGCTGWQKSIAKSSFELTRQEISRRSGIDEPDHE